MLTGLLAYARGFDADMRPRLASRLFVFLVVVIINGPLRYPLTWPARAVSTLISALVLQGSGVLERKSERDSGEEEEYVQALRELRRRSQVSSVQFQ